MERADSGGGVCATLAEEDGETAGLFVVIRPNAHPIGYLLIGELEVRQIVMRLQLFAVFGFA